MLITRDSNTPELNDPATPSFGIPPTLAELDHAEPEEGTVLCVAIQRVRRERRDSFHARGRFDNNVYA